MKKTFKRERIIILFLNEIFIECLQIFKISVVLILKKSLILILKN